MAIQGTQIPMYTKHILFFYFCIFQFFCIFMKNKINKIEKQPNKNMLNKVKHKTRCKCMNKKRKNHPMEITPMF